MASHHQTIDVLSRREALGRVSAMFGGAALVAHAGIFEALTRASAEPARPVLSATDVALLDEIAETMLPETSTPGAKAAGVGPFMALMVADAYSPDEQQIFAEGLRTLERECTDRNGHGFMEATPAERLSLLERLDREQYDTMHARELEGPRRDDDAPSHYFRMMKELALLGYFTSEIGYTEAMRFVETPGRYEPCVPYSPGDKAWAPHA